ncbi:MAG: enzyme involved in methoxymalonyl-ACP biosynthesis, partial [Belnapia sp.]|nr:enzyme involved in methoxymalonyl-ACP biosynthesis [Belnapia sp.]
MEQLAWLPLHPDLGAAIGAAKRLADPVARLAEAARLAGHRRDFTATGRLDRLAAEGLTESAAGFAPLRLAILASHTVDHLVPAIRVAGLHRGLALSVHLPSYGQYRQALLGDDPALAAFAPQIVLLALDSQDQPLDLPLDSPETVVHEAVADRVASLRLLWRRARERFNATVIQQTLVAADPPVFGAYELLVPASPGAVIERLNA